jgi:hypothetical protein
LHVSYYIYIILFLFLFFPSNVFFFNSVVSLSSCKINISDAIILLYQVHIYIFIKKLVNIGGFAKYSFIFNTCTKFFLSSLIYIYTNIYIYIYIYIKYINFFIFLSVYFFFHSLFFFIPKINIEKKFFFFCLYVWFLSRLLISFFFSVYKFFSFIFYTHIYIFRY